MPALPLDEAGKYVAAAYLVFFALVIIYVGIMAARLARLERQVVELDELSKERAEEGERARQQEALAGSARTSMSDPDATSGVVG